MLISCGNEQSETENIFVMNQMLGVETLEPVMSNTVQTIWVLSMLMEGLVSFDKQNKIKPTIAKSWEISDNGLEYTFILRDDVYFHDDECFPGGKGRKVTAYDFEYCLTRVNDPKSMSRGAWVWRDKIKGASEYIDARSKDMDEPSGISGIKVVNDTTLVLTLVSPFAPFLSTLTMSYGYVYPHEAVEHYGSDIGQNPVGTGPFKFLNWDIGKEMNLTRNEKYWDKDSDGNQLPYLDGVKMTFTQSSETEFLDFVNGKYDFHLPSSETFAQITDENGELLDAGEKKYSLVKQPWLQTVFFGMMQAPNLPGGIKGPFVNNKKLRQALNYAIDRDKIIKFVLKNRGVSAHNGPIPPGMPGFNPDIKGYTYDPDKAKKLLEEAGYPNGKGLKLTLHTGNDEIQKTIAIAVQEQLKSFGIDLKLDQMLQATLISNQEEGLFPFWRASWGADYFDPENFMALFYSKNITPKGPNRVGYSNPLVDKLYEQGLEETDFEKRMKLYDEIQRIVIEDAAWLFLYYNEQVYLLSNKVHGFYIDGLNIIRLKETKKQ
ncbi:MAG: peptide/nickel transport system substrate-binding protein [Chlorobi bacterium OLB4]|nr:MAG: peptide/nickel transport system substrate-binding protein [Chlorobi bacterium OLB4]